MKKRPKSITLYTFETNCTRGANDWNDIKCLEGTTTDRYPSETYKSFTSYKKAKKAAKMDAHDLCVAQQEWYFIIAFTIDVKVISKMFDGLYGADGPECIIKKVYPLKFVKPEEYEIPKEPEEDEEHEEYVEETINHET